MFEFKARELFCDIVSISKVFIIGYRFAFLAGAEQDTPIGIYAEERVVL